MGGRRPRSRVCAAVFANFYACFPKRSTHITCPERVFYSVGFGSVLGTATLDAAYYADYGVSSLAVTFSIICAIVGALCAIVCAIYAVMCAICAIICNICAICAIICAICTLICAVVVICAFVSHVICVFCQAAVLQVSQESLPQVVLRLLRERGDLRHDVQVHRVQKRRHRRLEAGQEDPVCGPLQLPKDSM